MVRRYNITDQNLYFSHTESVFTDIQSDYGCIKQERYFGHQRNAVSPFLSHNKSDVAPTWTEMNMLELSTE